MLALHAEGLHIQMCILVHTTHRLWQSSFDAINFNMSYYARNINIYSMYSYTQRWSLLIHLFLTRQYQQSLKTTYKTL